MLVQALLLAISVTANAIVLFVVLRFAGVPNTLNTPVRAVAMTFAMKTLGALLHLLPWGLGALVGPCVHVFALVQVYRLAPGKALAVAFAHATLMVLLGCGLGV